MTNVKMTLPSMTEDQQKPFALRGWAISNGAYCSSSTRTINGIEQKSGYGLSRVAFSFRVVP